MMRTKIEKDFRVTIPEPLRDSLKVGDELLINKDDTGRIVLIPEDRIIDILNRTAGLWKEHSGPKSGVAYVNHLRRRKRLKDLEAIPNEDN